MDKINITFAKPLGSFLKAFLATVLTLWLVELQAGHQLFDGTWEMAKKLLTLAKELEFKTAEQYFEYCIESHINGQLQQCKDLFNAMNKADKKQCLNYIMANYRYSEQYKFYFNLL